LTARSPAGGVVEGSGGLRIRGCWGGGGSGEGIDRRWAVVCGRTARRRGGAERRRPGQVSGGGVASKEGGDATSVSVAAVEGGGRQSQGRRSLLRLDAFQSQKAMNRRPLGPCRSTAVILLF